MTEQDLEKELEDADDRAIEIGKTGNQKGAFQLAKEIAARAKSEGLLFPYLIAQFRLMNTARNLFDAAACKDACLSSLALLESPEAAAAFQPGYDEDKYGWFQHWMSPCSYDNLAEATALSDGYNSSGLHRCVADGIDVCNRVGKTECITCFREYASKVFRAADDMDMALFHTRRNMKATPQDEDSDRRYVGAQKTFELEMLLGRASAAAAALVEAVKLAPTFHDQRETKHDLSVGARELATLIEAGEVVPPAGALGLDLDALIADAPPAALDQEYLEEAFDRLLVDTLGLTVRGDLAGAEESLVAWDKRLRADSLLEPWFEVRLRRVALAMMDGDDAKRAVLAAELEKAALAADDHLTLRRLRGLGGLRGAALAMARLGPLRWGGEGGSGSGPARTGPTEEPSLAAEDPDFEANAGEVPAYARRLDAFFGELDDVLERAQEEGPEEGPEAAAGPSMPNVLDWLKGEEAQVDRAPAAELLGAASRMVRYGPMDEERASGLWDWARSAAASAPDDGVALARAAEVGAYFVDRPEPLLQDRLSSEAVERLFERAMVLSPDEHEPFGRAGLRHVRQDQPEKAERPLARSARLHRHQVSVVLSLAGIYQGSGREGDALELIDLSVRDGCDEPDLLWEGALMAPALGRDQLALSYLDRYRQHRPEVTWVNYYRAKALLALGRFDEVAAACALEAELTDDNAFGRLAFQAEASKALGEEAALADALAAVLETALYGIDSMSRAGVMSAFARALDAAEGTAMATPLRARALAAGLMPDELLRTERMAREKVEGLEFFEVTLRQTLDSEAWQAYPARMLGQEDWTAYEVNYGVLAGSESEAKGAILDLHVAAPGPGPEVLRCEGNGGEYEDHPGVTFQSYFSAAE